MTDPAPAASSVASDSAKNSLSSPGETWFGTNDGRRYGWEIGAIVIVKLALLLVLWFVFIKPWPRPAMAPSITVQQFYLPSAPPVRHD